MYYQVGNQCLEQQQAENVYFGLVVPVLKPDGQIIQANLPECNPADNVKNGLEIGWSVFGVMAACYFVIVIKRLLK